MNGSVLVVDDDTDMCDLIRAGLHERGFEIETTADVESALRLMAQREFDVVVTDVQLGAVSGLELCKRVVAEWPDVPVVVITAYSAMEVAVSAIRAGAYDFLDKPFRIVELALTLERAVRHRLLQDEVRRLRKALDQARRAERLIGDSPAMSQVCAQVAQVAASDVPVLVTGESGTGKELVARAIHERSARRGAPFVAVDCASLSPAALEGELFGRVRPGLAEGERVHQGALVQASGGVLFLDEVGAMPVALQDALMRALEQQQVRPVGGRRAVSFDTRIIAASSDDLPLEVARQRFLVALYEHLDTACVRVPPLRLRGDDVLLLAQHFLERYARRHRRPVVGMSGIAAQMLLRYDWPGNVRELEKTMERAVLMAMFTEIAGADLPPRIREHLRTGPAAGHREAERWERADLPSLDEVALRYARRVLGATDLSLASLEDDMMDDRHDQPDPGDGPADGPDEGAYPLDPLCVGDTGAWPDIAGLDDPLALPSLSDIEQRYVRHLVHTLRRTDKMPRG